MPAAATRTLVITATVETDLAVENTATINESDQTDLDLTDNSDTVLVVPEPGADLSVEKTANRSTVDDGDRVRFDVLVENAGPSDAEVVLGDTLPQGLTLVSTNVSQGDYDTTARVDGRTAAGR